MSQNQSILFMMESIPDIDRMVPVIYKLTEETSISISILLCGDSVSDEDYRLQYIARRDRVSIHHYPDTSTSEQRRIQRLKRYGKRLPTNIPRRAWQWYQSVQLKDNGQTVQSGGDISSQFFSKYVANHFFSSEATRLAVVPFYRQGRSISLADELTHRNIKVIALSHGNEPLMNKIQTMPQINSQTTRHASENLYDYQCIYDDMQINVYDVVTVPNDMQARRYQRYLSDTPIKTLGSPRYNEEWVEILSSISHEMSSNDSVTRIIFFLRHENYLVNKAATEATIRLIAQFPSVELLLAEHPRRTLFESEAFSDLSNVLQVNNEYSSETLMKSGDVFLDMGTSITFEAVVRNQPVLSMDHLHPNVTTTGYYLKSAKMDTIDEVYKSLVQILTEKQAQTYTNKERITFINQMINPLSGTDVLSRYVSVIMAHL